MAIKDIISQAAQQAKKAKAVATSNSTKTSQGAGISYNNTSSGTGAGIGYTYSYGDDTTDDGSGYDYSGYSLYGSSGSSGSGSSTDPQEAFDTLGAVVGYNLDTLTNKGDQADKIFDISDQQNKNLQLLQTTQNKRNAGNDWYTQQQKLQTTTSALADSMGNAMNGSSLYELWDLVARKDDIDDVEVLNTMRENQNTVDNDYWTALFKSNNSRNENYMNIENELRDVAADYIAQGNSLDSDVVSEYVDTDNHTLNLPDWINTEYFNKHVRSALTPTEQGLYRPANAAQTATANGLRTVNQDYTESNAQGANQDYWSRMRSGYSRRTQ